MIIKKIPAHIVPRLQIENLALMPHLMNVIALTLTMTMEFHLNVSYAIFHVKNVTALVTINALNVPLRERFQLTRNANAIPDIMKYIKMNVQVIYNY